MGDRSKRREPTLATHFTARFLAEDSQYRRAVLFLAEHRAADSDQVAEALDVPEAEAQATLRSLAKAGLVYVSGSEEDTYRPDPLLIARVVEAEEREIESGLADAKQYLTSVRKAIRAPAFNAPGGLPAETYYRVPPELAIPYTRHAILQAEESLAISSYRFDWFFAVKDLLRQKLGQDVAVRIILADPDQAQVFREDHRKALRQRIKDLKAMDVKVVVLPKRPAVRGTLVDGQLGLLALYDPFGETVGPCSEGLLIFREPTLVMLFKSYMQCAPESQG